jgi:prophage regulatory protein
MAAPTQLRRLPQVQELTGLSRSTIYQFIADGKFPSPVRIGARAVAWRESDLLAWQNALVKTGGGK